MSEERKKILEMVKDGTITIQEAEELFQTLDAVDLESEAQETKETKSTSYAKKHFDKEELRKVLARTRVEIGRAKERTAEALSKASDKIKEEASKVDQDKVKENIKKGYFAVDQVLESVDKAITGALSGVSGTIVDFTQKQKTNDVSKEAKMEARQEAKEQLEKAKENIQQEMDKTDNETVKAALQKGYEKIDKALRKVDKAILDALNLNHNNETIKKEEE